MSDPSVEAAQRAWNERYGMRHEGVFGIDFETNGLAAGYVAAAREMAKSVQELHRRRASGAGLGYRAYCDECQALWPCETAKRVYPSEELGL